VLSALRTARQHPHPEGFFILDVWCGPPLLHLRLSQQVKVIPNSEGYFAGFLGGLDIRRHVCTVDFHVWRLEKEQLLVNETEEGDVACFFLLRKLEFLIECEVFVLKRSGTFSDFDQDPDEMT
jgi:hypothetical protein